MKGLIGRAEPAAGKPCVCFERMKCQVPEIYQSKTFEIFSKYELCLVLKIIPHRDCLTGHLRNDCFCGKGCAWPCHANGRKVLLWPFGLWLAHQKVRQAPLEGLFGVGLTKNHNHPRRKAKILMGCDL